MSSAAGLVFALASAFALNWGWLAQHSAASELPALSLRTPVRSLRTLFSSRSWLVGFLVGIAGWALYIAALALAPLSLVQAVSAGGIGILALLARGRGNSVSKTDWAAVAVSTFGLALLAATLAGGTPGSAAPTAGALAAWVTLSGAIAALAFVSRPLLAAGGALGIAAGVLYAAGDVATKAATFGGAWLLLVPLVLLAHGSAFVSLQLGFQRGGPLATAGSASLLTNALPIAAGILLFHEHLPGGTLGLVRLVAFACVVIAAAALARRESPLEPSTPAQRSGPTNRENPSYGKAA